MRRSEVIVLAACVACCLGVGSTSLMPAEVYSSWWWFAFWAAVGVALCVSVWRSRMWRRPAMFLLHISFILMLIGGALTSLTAIRGTLHLSPDVETESFMDDSGLRRPLPLAMRLDTFCIEYYPGMSFPRDFHSRVEAGGDIMEISMNRVGRTGGWRFYQTSFDDAGGTILSVSHDPWGTGVSYAGYLLFALAGGWMLLRRYLHVGRGGGAGRGIVVLVVLLVSGVSSSASAVPVVPEAVADSLAERQVVFRGKVVPFGTMASQLTWKLTGGGSVGELSPERFVASLLVYGDRWRDVRFLRIKEEGLARMLGADKGEGYVSPAALYDSVGVYIPQRLYRGGKGVFDSEILRLDEKVALLGELCRGELFIPLEEGSCNALSGAEVKASLLYSRVRPVRIYFMLLLVGGMVTLFMGRYVCAVAWSLAALGIAVFGWRWWLAGYMPLAGVGDIMEFTAVALSVVAALASRRLGLAGSLGLLMAGFVALTAWLSMREPALTPLMPVLASAWLSVHVSLVMAAYALLGMTLPLSLASLFLRSRRGPLSSLCGSLLGPGVWLLGLGIFVGAMWANVSWGRYWAWDPKETWALVTMMLYAVPLHRGVGLTGRPVARSLYLCFAFLSIIMTYAGVNLLESNHAYI